ncbi:hypothetical protein D4764_07G0000510, partial [Takifugu flavidus]
YYCYYIHPSILYRLSGVGSRGQQPKKRSPDFPLPSYFFQLIRRDPETFPDQSRDIVSPTCPRSSRGSHCSLHCFPFLRRLMVVQQLFDAVQKSFSMASLNSSHARVFASATAVAALRLACRYLSAASGVPQASEARYDSFFSLTVSLTAGVHQWVRVLPPRQAPTTLRPQHRRLCQAFPADPHNMFGPAGSVQHSSPPSEPTHHQVVIS